MLVRGKTRSGFTLVELSLSLVFVATLSLIVALLISNTVSSYRRGLTLNQINTVGMDLVDDMRTTIQNSTTKSVTSACNTIYSTTAEIQQCEQNGGSEFVSKTWVTDVEIAQGKTAKNVPMTGVFCTGSYSYIWNSGYLLAQKRGGYPKYGDFSATTLKYDGGTQTGFRLLKIRDDARAVCITMANNNTFKGGQINISTYKGLVSETPIDLLKATASAGAGNNEYTGLALYDLSVAAPADSVSLNNLFYSVAFVLGTTEGGINVTASGNFCAPPNDYANENFDYCAINKFNFAARAMGE